MVLAVVAAFFLASHPASAAGWWNESWHFRAPINVSFPSIASNASVNASINFTSILNGLNITGTFDKNSIRVVENGADVPSDFLNSTINAGNLSWVVNGSTAANTNRTFYIYFDIVENGAKAAGKVISESCNSYGNNTCYWRSGYTNNNNIWSNQSASPGLSYEWNRSWASLIEISWKWNTENGFDNAYLYADGAFYSQKSGVSSETVQIAASRLSARFTSDNSGSYPAYGTSDSYGIYGTAVDIIKFYPTASVTTPAFTAGQSAAEKQYAPSVSNISVSASGGWGGTFNYTMNTSDPENDNVSVTLFTNENGVWNRKAMQIANGTVLNWTIAPFSCNDIGSINYMFEYNDSSHAPVNTSNYSQTLDKDSINMEYYSGNASVNREGNGNITFGIRLNDTDRMAYVSGQTVNFWAFYSNVWNSLGTNTTISTPSGAALYNFNPNCNVEANAHQWKTNYTGTCYKTNESANFTFTALGQLKNYLIQPSYLATYDLGDAAPIEANITDECSVPVSGATANLTVNATNQTMVDQSSGKYNYSWSSSGKATGNYTIQINASKLFYNFNLTSWLNWFALVAGPPQINLTMNASQAAQNAAVLINASVTDMSSTGITWVRANITYPNSTVALYNMTNNSGVWQTILNDTLQRGQYNITIYATDNAGKTGNSTSSTSIYARMSIVMNSQDYTIEKDWYGSVYYKASDANATLQGVNVTLSVQRPDGAELMWFSNIKSYATNSYGLLNTPTFVIPAGIPPGAYKITAVSAFNDTLAGIVVNNTTSYNFTMNNASSSSSSNTVTAKIVVPTVQYVGHDLSFVALFYNSSGLVDADNISVIIYQLTSQYNSTQWISKTKSDMSKLGAGIYTYSQSIAAGTSTGNYLVVLNSSSGGIAANDISSFEILQGGPFDISIIPVQSEVSQGETIYFDINITNKGPVDRGDSTVTYWIGDGSRYYATTSVFVAARGNVSLRKSFSIFSDEAVGVKNISVKVDYDPFYGPSNASSTFLVKAAIVQPPSVPPSGGGGGGGGAAAPAANISNVSIAAPRIEISEYPAEIEIERGWAKFITVSLNNTGSGILHNISVQIKDIPQGWSEIQTAPAAQMSGSQTFLIRFSVPDSVKSGNYRARIRAVSAEASDEKDVIVRIFASKEELIKYQIETIREKLSALEAITNQTEREGKDVRTIRSGIADINAQISVAENYLNNKKYDDASNAIYNVREMINTLRGDLESLRREKAEAPLISWMLIAIIGLVAAIAVIFVYFYRKIKGNETLAMQKFYEMKRMILGRASGARTMNDMEKTRRMIRLIQKEYDEELISKETYEELKRINEEKLLTLSKKMSDLGLKE